MTSCGKVRYEIERAVLYKTTDDKRNVLIYRKPHEQCFICYSDYVHFW